MNSPDFSKMTRKQILTEFRKLQNTAREARIAVDNLKMEINRRYHARACSAELLSDEEITCILLSKEKEGEK